MWKMPRLREPILDGEDILWERRSVDSVPNATHMIWGSWMMNIYGLEESSYWQIHQKLHILHS